MLVHHQPRWSRRRHPLILLSIFPIRTRLVPNHLQRDSLRPDLAAADLTKRQSRRPSLSDSLGEPNVYEGSTREE